MSTKTQLYLPLLKAVGRVILVTAVNYVELLLTITNKLCKLLKYLKFLHFCIVFVLSFAIKP